MKIGLSFKYICLYYSSTISWKSVNHYRASFRILFRYRTTFQNRYLQLPIQSIQIWQSISIDNPIDDLIRQSNPIDNRLKSSIIYRLFINNLMTILSIITRFSIDCVYIIIYYRIFIDCVAP